MRVASDILNSNVRREVINFRDALQQAASAQESGQVETYSELCILCLQVLQILFTFSTENYTSVLGDSCTVALPLFSAKSHVSADFCKHATAIAFVIFSV